MKPTRILPDTQQLFLVYSRRTRASKHATWKPSQASLSPDEEAIGRPAHGEEDQLSRIEYE
ncbi:hypothetical protein WAI453_007925 [Rhynchosporium graminicola]